MLQLELPPNHDSDSVIDREFESAAIATPASDTPPQLSQPQTIAPATHRGLWRVFGTTFITIFLAELGDKTQVSTLLMSAESHAPWVVFTGAAAALMTTSLLGVVVGQWLSKHLTPKTLDTAAGLMLMLISVWLFWDVFRG